MKKLILLAAVLFVSVTFSYSQFTFTSIDCPGAERTRTHGINNNGDIVGSCKYPGDNMHAVLIRKGEFTPLAPTTVLGTNFSVAYKINGHNDVVGIFIGDDGFYHGFLLRDGVLTILDFPGANETYATGLNDSGMVTGWWNLYDSYGNINIQHGFIWKDGTFTDVTFPGAEVAAATGINARGDFVGGWSLSIDAPTQSGFVLSKGQFTSFDAPFPGVWLTQPDDINDTGKIVGQYYDDITYQPRGYLKVADAFTNIDYPGATQTTPWGINSAGQMVGNYRIDSSGAIHGWLAQPGNEGKPRGQVIAYASNLDGGLFQVFAMKANGDKQTQLTHELYYSGRPNWSHDGGKITFTTVLAREWNGEIRVMNADGSGRANLTNSPANEQMSVWSPDDKKIAFVSDRDGFGQIYVMNADGSDQTRISDGSGQDLYPSWSPDGSKIAFEGYRGGNYDVYVMNADGSNPVNLTNNTAIDGFPAWSPRGDKIAFRSDRDGTGAIYVMNIDGSGQTRLTDNLEDEYYPAWSPTGEYIAFAGNASGNYQIYVMNANGSGQRRITHDDAFDADPAWAPLQ